MYLKPMNTFKSFDNMENSGIANTTNTTQTDVKTSKDASSLKESKYLGQSLKETTTSSINLEDINLSQNQTQTIISSLETIKQKPKKNRKPLCSRMNKEGSFDSTFSGASTKAICSFKLFDNTFKQNKENIEPNNNTLGASKTNKSKDKKKVSKNKETKAEFIPNNTINGFEFNNVIYNNFNTINANQTLDNNMNSITNHTMTTLNALNPLYPILNNHPSFNSMNPFITYNINVQTASNLHKQANSTLYNQTFQTFKTYSNLIPNLKTKQKVETEEAIFNFRFETKADSIKCAGEYLNEIYKNLLEDEKSATFKPVFEYMKKQEDINSQMRAILLDWLVEVHLRFHLVPQTFYCCVFIIDAYLSQTQIKRVKLQLLGIAALLIACKIYEIHYPKLEKFTEITDNAYNVEELLEMENNILSVLKFDISSPTALEFYEIIAKAFNFDKKQYYLGRYFIESALIDDYLLKYSYSIIACACSYIVMKFFGIRNYSILYKAGVLLVETPQKIIKDAARDICFLVKNLSRSSLKALKEKYAMNCYENVSELCEEH